MIKKRFHFCGPSHTAGGGFEFHCKPKAKLAYNGFNLPMNEYSFSYAGCLGRLLGSEYEVLNHAKCGYGNELLYRKVFEVIENPNFNKDNDILFLEFSDVGRKEFWNNKLNINGLVYNSFKAYPLNLKLYKTLFYILKKEKCLK